MISLTFGLGRIGLDSMEFETNEYNEPTLYLDFDDLCWLCKNQYGCPLIECINLGLVVPTGDIKVGKCELYEDATLKDI